MALAGYGIFSKFTTSATKFIGASWWIKISLPFAVVL